MMSWIPQFFAPSAAWLFALLIPVVVVYFLKLRRDRVQISSLALWRQVINDQRVNSPFQRFKRNLLLLLQLALLTLIVLSAMQPFIPGTAGNADVLPILIDCSASMGATDESGKTRLDLAKAEIEKLIDGLLPGHQLTLISVSSTARRLTEFTDNKAVLRDALRKIQVQDLPSKIDDGLRLTQALARTQPIEHVRFYSDGNLPTRPNPVTGRPQAIVDVDLPFQLDFFQIPPVSGNLGVTAMNARRASAGKWNVFLRVDGSSVGGSEAEILLTSNGNEVGREQVVLSPGESQRLVFSVPADEPQQLQASVIPRGHDALAADNLAWLNLPAGRDIVVSCPETLPAFRHALASMEGVRLLQSGDDPANVDLLISDQAADAPKAAPLTVLVGVIPDELQAMIKVEPTPAEVIDWQRDAQLLQHVQLKDVLLSELPVKQPGAEETQMEQMGYDILASGPRGPVLLKKQSGQRETYFFLFHLDKSTLPYRVGFPVLVSNIVNEALQLSSLGELSAATTGMLPPQKLTAAGTYDIQLPDGEREVRTANEAGVLTGIAADKTGEYEIRSGGNLVEKLGASLLNSSETSLAAVDKIEFNEVSAAAQTERLQTDRPLWTQVAFAAFCLLLFEWWFFQKKPAGVPDY
ncbi:vWA domain-containing protein [Planctomicrobium piriforme]|uniref:von Willebrand factor type A domain-containing protein n=1 Tax=Planctomicrobium piriforme TaxID=1576369 RepID=A0A1I3C5M7_9PLAN|nr:BatA and WFA domain-containing protein [Planctomicrobium piriforme]SFH69844.1 von Willebrand factor type A domain-containing protein [Planctomicrobium piriforme]